MAGGSGGRIPPKSGTETGWQVPGANKVLAEMNRSIAEGAELISRYSPNLAGEMTRPINDHYFPEFGPEPKDIGTLPLRHTWSLGSWKLEGMGITHRTEVSLPLTYSLGSVRDPASNEFIIPTPEGARALSQKDMVEAAREANGDVPDGAVITDVIFLKDGKARVQYQSAEGMLETANIGDSGALAKAVQARIQLAPFAARPPGAADSPPPPPTSLLTQHGRIRGLETGDGTWVEAGPGLARFLHDRGLVSFNPPSGYAVRDLVRRADGKIEVEYLELNTGIVGRVEFASETFRQAIATDLVSFPAVGEPTPLSMMGPNGRGFGFKAGEQDFWIPAGRLMTNFFNAYGLARFNPNAPIEELTLLPGGKVEVRYLEMNGTVGRPATLTIDAKAFQSALVQFFRISAELARAPHWGPHRA
jgi:hypothetical protein